VARFALVEPDGTPSPDRVCPFCGGRITIGHFRPPGQRPDPGLTVVHAAAPGFSITGDGDGTRTGCAAYDAAPGPEEYLEKALPRLIAAQALTAAHRGGVLVS
jgi:hypothetical protein